MNILRTRSAVGQNGEFGPEILKKPHLQLFQQDGTLICRNCAVTALVNNQLKEFGIPLFDLETSQKCLLGIKEERSLTKEEREKTLLDLGYSEEYAIVKLLKHFHEYLGDKIPPEARCAVAELLKTPVEIRTLNLKVRTNKELTDLLTTISKVPVRAPAWQPNHVIVIIAVKRTVDGRFIVIIEECGTRYEIPLEIYVKGFFKNNSLFSIVYINFHTPDGVPIQDIPDRDVYSEYCALKARYIEADTATRLTLKPGIRDGALSLQRYCKAYPDIARFCANLAEDRICEESAEQTWPALFPEAERRPATEAQYEESRAFFDWCNAELEAIEANLQNLYQRQDDAIRQFEAETNLTGRVADICAKLQRLEAEWQAFTDTVQT